MTFNLCSKIFQFTDDEEFKFRYLISMKMCCESYIKKISSFSLNAILKKSSWSFWMSTWGIKVYGSSLFTIFNKILHTILYWCIVIFPGFLEISNLIVFVRCFKFCFLFKRDWINCSIRIIKNKKCFCGEKKDL